MNTPPTGVPNSPSLAELGAGAIHNTLFKKLENVARNREEATPEVQSPGHVEECHQWRCEELQNHFQPHEAEQHRMGIPQPEYWELECLQYHEALQKWLWNQASTAHGLDGEPTADHWRTLAESYKGLLTHIGLSSPQIGKIRQSINNQDYWKVEAELYEKCVALDENEMREALRNKDKLVRKQSATRLAKRAKRPRSVDRGLLRKDGIARSRKRLAAEPAKRGGKRPQSIDQQLPAKDGIASRTRSRTKTGA